MDLTLLVGAKRLKLNVDEESDVCALMKIVAEKTQIKEINQKLIFKGVTLTKESGKLLSEFGIKNGSKIMVVGKRYDSEEEAALGVFKGIENNVRKLSKETDGLDKQIQSIKKGFLQQEYRAEAYEKIKKELQKNSHTLMKNLETIDSMSIAADFKDAKSKRKYIVDEVQKLMDRCDFIIESMDNDL